MNQQDITKLTEIALALAIQKDDLKTVKQIHNDLGVTRKNIMSCITKAASCLSLLVFDYLLTLSDIFSDLQIHISPFIEQDLYSLPIHQVFKKHNVYKITNLPPILNKMLLKGQFDVAEDMLNDSQYPTDLLYCLEISTFYTLIEKMPPSFDYPKVLRLYSREFEAQFINVNIYNQKIQILSYFVKTNKHLMLNQYICQNIFTPVEFAKYNIKQFVADCKNEEILQVLESHGMRFTETKYLEVALHHRNLDLINALRKRNNHLTFKMLKDYMFDFKAFFWYVIKHIPSHKYERLLKWMFFKLDHKYSYFLDLKQEETRWFLIKHYSRLQQYKRFKKVLELAHKAVDDRKKQNEVLLPIIQNEITIDSRVLKYIVGEYL